MTRKKRTQRLRRVDETLRQIISEALLANRDRHLEGIVVTGVETSSDTAYADVYVQVPGNDAKRERGLAALERVRPSIQHKINDEMHLRLTPVLRFRRDETLEHSIRIEQLLAEHKPVDPPPADPQAKDERVSELLDAAYDAAAAALRAAPRVVVATHENPDGDALGSLVGAVRGLRAAGLDAVGVRAAADLPREYRWLDDDGLETTVPDGTGWLLLAVDCGSSARIALPAGVREGSDFVIDLDHHHDNTRFGDINIVDDGAACAAMMVLELLARLGVTLTPAIATPLYVGLVTDTGRFQYSNTDARAFRVAAELVELGVRPQEVFQHVFESVQASKLQLLARALGRIELRLDGRLALTWLTRADIDETAGRRGRDRRRHRQPAGDRGRRGGRVHPRDVRRAAPQGVDAVGRRRGRRVADRPRLGRGRPHAGRGLLQRPRPRRADRPDRARGTGRRCLRRPACCCSTRRPATAPSARSPRCGRCWAASSATRARSTRSRPGC